MSDLPQELIEYLLDEDIIEFKELKACALVSRRWVRPARLRLFYKFSIDSIIESPQYNVFCDILQSSPGIADCVRNFSFIISPITFSNDWLRLVASICAKFTNVKTFRFIRYHFISFYEHVNRQFLQSLRPIMETATSLTVHDVEFENRNHLYRFISAFPNVTYLNMHNTGCTKWTKRDWEGPRDCFNLFSPQIPRLALRTLHLSECYGDMTQLFQPSTSEIRSLRLHIRMLSRPDHPIGISAFPSLQFVEFFDFEQDSPPGDYDMCQIVGKMPKLREFRINMTLKLAEEARDKSEWLSRLLSNLPTTIRDIYITVEGGVYGLDEMDWSSIDRVFERNKFNSLQIFLINVKTFGMLPIIKQTLLEGLLRTRAVKQRRVGVMY